MLRSIEDSCRRGDRTIDFGPGEREHKRRLRTRTESTYRLTYTPIDSWRSQAVRLDPLGEGPLAARTEAAIVANNGAASTRPGAIPSR